MSAEPIMWFDALAKASTHVAGGKGANLGELTRAGLPVPPGFVITAQAYMEALEAAGIRRQLEGLFARTDPDQPAELAALAEPDATRRVLTDHEAVALASLGLEVEQHYGAPQDIEWAERGGVWYLVQTRRITTLGERPSPVGDGALVTGLGASPGIARGTVRVLRSPDEGPRLVAGEILVAPITSPDWVPTIRRAAALVTDSGGVTSHAAIVSRELRIPCVVGTRTATRMLRDGEPVTVDGSRGRVTVGAPHAEAVAPHGEAAALTPPPAAAREHEPLATRVYVNLAIADHVESAAALPVDGVGLLRAEFMIADALGGRHPKALLARDGAKEFHVKMSTSLLRITRAFYRVP